MVRYIVTPWRNRRELLSVRRAFYPTSEVSKETNEEERREAVELVSVWVQRGNCPHSVESTALLVSAMLNEAGDTPKYAIRAAYSTAFSRFVTGLLDGYQDKKHKLSMYSIAKNIALPATFVELRHQCTHEELPSLAKLRAATDRSLLWIWDHYWKNLEDPVVSTDNDQRYSDLLEYLQWLANYQAQDEDRNQNVWERLRKLNREQILEGLMEINNASTTEPRILQHSLRLSRAILNGEDNLLATEPSKTFGRAPEKKIRSLEDIRADIAGTESILEEEEAKGKPSRSTAEEHPENMDEDDDDEDWTGWRTWRGPWVAKPIGVV